MTQAVRVLHLDRRGRGRALKPAWLHSDADILAHMDVDLSTELGALPLMVAALREGADIAIASRLAPGARVERGVRRAVISRCYNVMLRVGFRDAQCGCKARRASTRRPPARTLDHTMRPRPRGAVDRLPSLLAGCMTPRERAG